MTTAWVNSTPALIGRTLDWLHDHDPTALFAVNTQQARQRFGIPACQALVDTTSFAVTGEYDRYLELAPKYWAAIRARLSVAQLSNTHVALALLMVVVLLVAALWRGGPALAASLHGVVAATLSAVGYASLGWGRLPPR